jgi:Cu/Ag efflux protein CusF
MTSLKNLDWQKRTLRKGYESVRLNRRIKLAMLLLIALLTFANLISCSDKAGGKEQQLVQAQYTSRGTVVSVNPSSSRIELDHEEIKGLMPAMTMPFRVNDAALLTGLKPGDQVTFVLDVNSGIELITKIEKTSNR